MYRVYIWEKTGIKVIADNVSYSEAMAIKAKYALQGKSVSIEDMQGIIDYTNQRQRIGQTIQEKYNEVISNYANVIEKRAEALTYNAEPEKKLPTKVEIATYLTVIVLIVIFFSYRK